MIEQITYHDLNGNQVRFEWNGSWYLIPFFLLEDISDRWMERKNWKKDRKWQQLRDWMIDSGDVSFNGETFVTNDTPATIGQLKELLAEEMQFMEAFKLHDI